MAIVARFPSPRRGRRRRLKSLAFLPSVMTLGNLLCGLAAIHFAARAMYELGTGVPAAPPRTFPSALVELMLPSFLSVGAGLVLLGMALDSFDGLLARMTRSTTDFGGQLDSLADVVTFGVAPAVLMVTLMTTHLADESILPSPTSAHLLGRFAWVSAAVYVAFTAIRLARFNVEHAKAEFDYRTFRGLPCPGAAALIVGLIIFQDQEVGQPFQRVIVSAMPFIALATAFLMVSRIAYTRPQRTYLVGRQPFGQFVGLVLIFAFFWLYKAPTLLLLALWYWLSGPVAHLHTRIRGRRMVAVVPKQEDSDVSTERLAN
ncbi:MAG: CDP-alcohol phosphatidyltransferase family protein [Planctomycetes bacterium]|nr:CDP-alcohol phosphatidyltransferase family protein [Planctomycetota bacterium]